MTLNFWKQIKEGAESFAKKREKEGGGFGATPLLPSTVEDTYFGLAILDLCQALDETSKSKHLSYLSMISWQELLPETFLYYLKALSLLDGARPNSKEFKKYLDEFLAKATSVKRLAILFSIAQTLDPTEQSERFSLKKSLPTEERLTLELLYYLLSPLPEFVEKNLNFVLSSQNPDGGFGFMPGTTSFMENTYFGINILYYFNRLEKEVSKKALSFVQSSLNGDFGFGRNSQGISFLNTTFYGLYVLRILLEAFCRSEALAEESLRRLYVFRNL
jgi:hypothetical protein